MATYIKTEAIKATKVLKTVGYCMYSVAELEDGREIPLTSSSYDCYKGDRAKAGNYFIENDGRNYFLSKESLDKKFQEVQ